MMICATDPAHSDFEVSRQDDAIAALQWRDTLRFRLVVHGISTQGGGRGGIWLTWALYLPMT
jgi:hypothetical protein